MRGLLRTVWLLGGGLLAAVNGAEPGAAPLADSQKALRELRQNRAGKAVVPADGKLRELLPTIETPGTPTAPTEFSGPPKPEPTAKAKPRRENWLLNGMEKLDDKNKPGTRKDRRDKNDDAAKSPPDEPGEPPDLLGLYSRQQKEEDAARSSAIKAGAPDPLAPFLKNWLTGSPVRGQFLDDPRKPTPTGANPERPAVSSQHENRATGGVLADLPGFRDAGGPVPVGSAPTNPYLRVLEIPTPDARPSPPPVKVPSGPMLPPGRPLLPATPAEKKAPPLAPTDDKKYFPQLKKF